MSFSLSKLLRVKLYSDLLILFDSISLVSGACDIGLCLGFDVCGILNTHHALAN